MTYEQALRIYIVPSVARYWFNYYKSREDLTR